MGIENQDRPTDVVREEVIDQLIFNYSHEALSLEAFEGRLDLALASNDTNELSELVADLELKVDKSYEDQKREELDLDLDYDYGAARDVEYSINLFGGSNRNGAWKRAKQRAELPDLRIHDLKHTFGRRLRAAGVSFEDRQDLLGHKSARMV